tara:strand:- start:6 stop:227 length:222 start_codon:yes stop_codon:yes gene_type:complete
MSKTNIRINNAFISYEDDKYYLSNITDLDEWNESSLDDLKESFKEVTEDVEKLMDDFENFSNVNFIVKGLSGG